MRNGCKRQLCRVLARAAGSARPHHHAAYVRQDRVFCDGAMLGMVTENTLYFRVDDHNRVTFKEAGSFPPTPASLSPGRDQRWRRRAALRRSENGRRQDENQSLNQRERGRTTARRMGTDCSRPGPPAVGDRQSSPLMAQIQPPIFGERTYIFLGVSQTMSRRRAKLAINAAIPDVHGSHTSLLFMRLTSRPSRCEATVTRSPVRCVKPLPTSPRSLVGANIVPRNNTKPSGY